MRQMPQVLAALLTAGTPWIVVRVGAVVASRHARRVGHEFVAPRTVKRLGWITAVVAMIAAAAAFVIPEHSGWLAVIGAATFVPLSVVGVRALGDLDRATRGAREIAPVAREAGLLVRRVSDYVPASWRASLWALAGVGVLTFVLRAMTDDASRQYLVPTVFIAASVIFMWLYEVWMRDLVSRPVIAGSADDEPARRRDIGGVFVAEVVLALTSLGVGHALLDLDWSRHGTAGGWLTAFGGLIGILGCALTLASTLARRDFATARR